MDKAINFAQLLKTPDPAKNSEINWLVKDFLPLGFVSILMADPKAGKTWIALRLACELSKGGFILGGLAKSDPLYVLYLMADTGESLVNYRLNKTGWSIDPARLRIVYSQDIHSQGADLDLGTKEGLSLLQGLTAAWNPDLLVIDTLSSVHTVDENDNAAIKPIVSGLRDLSANTGMSILVLHHSRKKKRSEMNMDMTMHDSSGAGVILRLVGNVIGIENSFLFRKINKLRK